MLMGNPFLFSQSLGRIGAVVLRTLKYSAAYLLSIRTFYREPRILTFCSSEQLLIQGGVLKLTWRTRYTAFVHIEGLGYFLGRNAVALPVYFKEKSFTLTAYSFLQKKSKTITVSAMDMPVLPQEALFNQTPEIIGIHQSQFALRRYKYVIRNAGLSLKHSIKQIKFPEL